MFGSTPVGFFDVPIPIGNNGIGADVDLTDLVFPDAFNGILIGYDDVANQCYAYTIKFMGSARPSVGRLKFEPGFDRSLQLLDIAYGESTGKVLVVGEGGTMLELIGDEIQTPLNYNLSGTLDVTTVTCSPTGPVVLAGHASVPEEASSAEFGKLVRFDGTSWSTVKAQTNKRINSIFLHDDDTGWILAGELGGAVDADPIAEFGMVGDTVFLHYDASN